MGPLLVVARQESVEARLLLQETESVGQPKSLKAHTSLDQSVAIEARVDGERGRKFVGEKLGRRVTMSCHQPSIARICASASGVVLTGRVTGAGAIRQGLLMPANGVLNPQIANLTDEERRALRFP